MRWVSVILASLLVAAPCSAQTFPVGERIVLSPADALATRAEITSIIEGEIPLGHAGYLSDKWSGFCCEGEPVAYFDRTPVTTRWLGYFWPGNMIARIHADTFPDSDCLLIYHAGHNQRFFVSPDEGPRAFVRRMVDEVRCDVLLVSMPLQGENLAYMPALGYPPENLTDGHYFLFADEARAPASGTPVRYWLDATYAAVDYMIEGHGPYGKIVAAGLSGGGWTTTLLAAVDPRITHAYAVSGSTPFGNVAENNDLEQTVGIAQLGIDYPDLYLMGTVDAAGNVTRKKRLLFTSNDTVLSRGQHTHVWALLDFARASGFGTQMLKVRVAYGSIHDISEPIADYIVNDVLEADASGDPAVDR